MAIDSAKGATVALDGKMVDRPVWLQAMRIAASAIQTGPTRLQASRVASR
jgi:citrate lyase beta subunit